MSFDTDMRYLNTDSIFIARVYMLSSESALWTYGVRSGDLVHCQNVTSVARSAGGFVRAVTVFLMLDDDTKKSIVVSDDTDMMVEWLVFEKRCKQGDMLCQLQQ